MQVRESLQISYFCELAMPQIAQGTEFRAKVAAGDGPATDLAIQYLEKDSKHFRSGYIKVDLADALKRSPLTSTIPTAFCPSSGRQQRNLAAASFDTIAIWQPASLRLSSYNELLNEPNSMTP